MFFHKQAKKFASALQTTVYTLRPFGFDASTNGRSSPKITGSDNSDA